MASEWRTYPVVELIRGGALAIGDGYRAKNDELGRKGLPFARAGNVNAGFRFEHADRFPIANLARVVDKVSLPGDVVFTSKGTVGRFAFVRNSTERFVYSPQLCFWRALDPTLIEPRFLYFWMHGREFYVQFKGVAGQTDMAEYVSLSDQRRMRITLPPPADQRAIAHILGTFDDKIELNRRMSETLETMALALFESFFVDVDHPALSSHPSPGGWETKVIGDMADVCGGATPSTKVPEFWDGEYSWATPKDLAALSSPVLLSTERRITDQGLSKIGSGLLPPGTVLLSSRAPIGYLAIAETPVAINQGFIAMKPQTGASNLFLLFWARANKEEILSRANGSTFLEISKANFRPIPVLAPPDAVMRAFDRAVRPLYSRMVVIEKESRTLTALRDRLLPKLISGELRVKDAEGFVDSVRVPTWPAERRVDLI